MTERVDPTPCYIGRGIVRQDYNNLGRVRLHSRSNPCGHVTRSNQPDPVPTFREFVEDWLDGYAVSIVPCDHCGGSL